MRITSGHERPQFAAEKCAFAGLTAALAFAAVHFAPMSNVFNPHATGGAFMLMGLFVLAVLDFCALVYFVPRAAMELYRQPNTRTGPHLAVIAAGVIALVVLGSFLNWFYHR